MALPMQLFPVSSSSEGFYFPNSQTFTQWSVNDGTNNNSELDLDPYVKIQGADYLYGELPATYGSSKTFNINDSVSLSFNCTITPRALSAYTHRFSHGSNFCIAY